MRVSNCRSRNGLEAVSSELFETPAKRARRGGGITGDRDAIFQSSDMNSSRDRRGKGGDAMSRAFLRDDAEGEMPRRNYALPERDDPEYDRAAARALLEAARVNETQLAERATGYYWGEPRLRPYMEDLRAEAEAAHDERGEQLAKRFSW